MTTLVATDLTKSGAILKSNPDFATAWAAAVGDSINQNVMYIGVDGLYNVYRIMLIFDTSTIPADAIIYSAYIALAQTDIGFGDGKVVVQNGMPTYPHDPVVVADFDKSFYSSNGGEADLQALPVVPAYTVIPLNPTGIEWINKGGSTKFCVRGDSEIAGLHGIGTAFNEYAGPTSPTGMDPRLIVNYYVPGQRISIIQCLNGSGEIYNQNANYATCRTAAVGTPNPGTGLINIGQNRNGGYSIFRGYLYFNTTGLSLASVADIQLVFTGAFDNSAQDFNIVVQSGQPAYPTYPTPVAADYDMTKYAGNYGQLGSASFVAEAENRISLSQDFLMNQMYLGIVKICLRSSRDIAGNNPALMTPELVEIYSPDEPVVTKRPKLEITYIGGRVAEAPAFIDIGWSAAQRGF